MPISATELATVGKTTLDFYLTKKAPIDQITLERPFLKHMMAKRKPIAGARENIIETLRTSTGSSAMFFGPSDTLTYTERTPLSEAKYPWYEFHDGMSINEHELASNGIVLNDAGKSHNVTGAEKIQLLNILEEKMEVLRLGAQESFSRFIQLNGSASANNIVGLDGLLPIDNATGKAGGIDRATSTWWRHHADATLTNANMQEKMEAAWRACSRHAVGKPNVILAGGDFIDEYRKACQGSGSLGGAIRQVTDAGKGGVNLDISTSGLYFKGVPIEYCPEWDDDFGGRDTTTNKWSKRCYFLNTNHITLRPLADSDFVTRQPPRPSTNYVHYWALLWRGALTMNMASAHAVLALK